MMLERFSCIKDGGLEIYTRQFIDQPHKIDSVLLSGFFFAIQSISEEIKNPVSFIKLQNCLVYIKSYGDFFLILMFTSLPEEPSVIRAFNDLAKVVTEYFTSLEKLDPPESFNNEVESILSCFKIQNLLEPPTNLEKVKKIAILGLAKAGKTSIKKKFFNRYSDEQLNDIRPTIGIETSKNLIEYLQETIMILDFGGQKIYRKKFLEERKNWDNITTIIYVIDIQDKNSFSESLDYLNKIWETINEFDDKPMLTIYLHKYDKLIEKSLESNIQEAISLFRDYIKNSSFFLTSITDNSSTKALIKTLFLSLPTLIVKQILQSFLIEMFQEKILAKFLEPNFNLTNQSDLFKSGEAIGDGVSFEFQKKWLNYYLGEYMVTEQQLNKKKIYLNQKGTEINIEIDNWENQGIPSNITDPFLTGFLTGIFKSLFINTNIISESTTLSTKWKINIGSNILNSSNRPLMSIK